MLFERIHASGMGLTIGSISPQSHVKNITFRDAYMYKTNKGVYMKFRANKHYNPLNPVPTGVIQDITYENIYMKDPERWPIWIGPAQQSDSANLCAAHPCSLCKKSYY